MRIAIDARELAGRPTGVGRYLAQLLAAWGSLPLAVRHEIVLCAPDRAPLPPTGGLPLRWLCGRGRGSAWEQLVLPRLLRRAGADVLFAPGYSAPLAGPAPVVVAIHDVSFVARPEWFPWRERWRRRLITTLTARRAARIITISEFSKQEIVRHLGVDSAKVEVTYLGVTALAPEPAAGGPDHQRGLVLFAGSLFSRRHIPELVAGFARLARRRSDVRLEIVGANRTVPRLDVARLIARSGAPDRITARSYISDRELGALYRAAGAFVFLSDYEGFGLTPLEALSAGVPVVVLDTAVSREIYGRAAVYVPQPDPVAIEAALERALFDDRERARILEAAGAVLRRYSWQECARRTLQILLTAGRERRSHRTAAGAAGA